MVRRVTLLQLIHAVQQHARSDDEVVAVVAHLVNTGQVVLRGNFAGCRWIVL